MTSVSLRTLLQIAWRNRVSDWRRFALSLTRNHADAEDLVDEAVVRTLRADPHLRSESEVHAYVTTAICNTWFMWAPVRASRLALLVKLGHRPEDYASSALQDLVAAEHRGRPEEAVGGALEKMKREIRVAFGLYLIGDPGLTLREIAEIQEVLGRDGAAACTRSAPDPCRRTEGV